MMFNPGKPDHLIMIEKISLVANMKYMYYMTSKNKQYLFHCRRIQREFMTEMRAYQIKEIQYENSSLRPHDSRVTYNINIIN